MLRILILGILSLLGTRLLEVASGSESEEILMVSIIEESNATLTGKIYGGEIYTGRKYAVYLEDGSTTKCTGTFILMRTVLIPAHCVFHLEPPLYNDYKIIYITKETSSDASRTIVYNIRRIEFHPAFTPEAHPFYTADIALILVKQMIDDVNDDCEVTPDWITLSPDSVKPDSGGRVLGWGPDSCSTEIVSQCLKMLQVTVIDNSLCDDWFQNAEIKSSLMCAISKQGSFAVEDAGAPLIQQVYHPKKKCWVEELVGIAVSPNSVEKFPAVYARISTYHTYIFDTMMFLEDYARKHPISPAENDAESPERRAMQNLSIDSEKEALPAKKSSLNKLSSLFKKPKK